ncbi:LacI family DNA-binding transcriptional regulator [Secundilactobacillus collinoides]|uniref:Glucose-resistance amylase regulator n=2 Tax=Secundilactobacillus collinoides TaxID=33960 RepID=A0A0R2B2L8_SECCO|nr:LacI family DNA-binding transcriptional regulator [Secundilactobacillus collinoides]KRM73285.1 glucose-resistance amylase regulator [Secundilactobacillus collinoides DSM 20515 = JCM 1123]KZL42454.1 LacI family transcriptional regulator [Secundilactobacillus collinoides]
MTVTIKDIAETANVSIATVSRVLANKEGFYSEKTAAKVRQAAEKLGYRKNTAAVELVTQRSKVIGVIVSATKTNFANDIIAGIQDEAFKHNLSVIILYAGESDPNQQHRALQTVIERSVMGILILAIRPVDDDIAMLRAANIPHLFLSTSFDSQNLPFIASDDFRIGYQATDFLIKKGHKKIGIAAIDRHTYIGTQRVLGYQRAMADHDLPTKPAWIQDGHFTYDDGIEAMKTFGAKPELDAVIGTSDLAAIGVMNQAETFGLNVPTDLAIMSIDGTQMVKIVRPQITSVTQSFYEMGSRGMKMMLQRDMTKFESQYTPFRIDEREST